MEQALFGRFQVLKTAISCTQGTFTASSLQSPEVTPPPTQVPWEVAAGSGSLGSPTFSDNVT